MKYTLPILALASLALSACATRNGDFPSLSKQPFEDEQVGIDVPAVPPAILENLPKPVQDALAAALDQSQTAHSAFLRDLPIVRKSVNSAAGAEPASESWVVAQMQLSLLETDRSPAVSALADVDAIYVTQLNAELESNTTGGAAIVAKARDRISAQVDAQQREIDKLKSGLR